MGIWIVSEGGTKVGVYVHVYVQKNRLIGAPAGGGIAYEREIKKCASPEEAQAIFTAIVGAIRDSRGTTPFFEIR